MNLRDFEELVLNEIKVVIQNIIAKHPALPIPVKKGERQGDAVSKFLEVNFVLETQHHLYLRDSSAAPIGKTKNPYDVETFFCIADHREKIWIDFKAINISNLDSNPDGGTPDKIISLIRSGSFYITYVFVYYEGEQGYLKFSRYAGKSVTAYFLKDVNPSVRITKVNQLQVNYSEPPVYRTRAEFINFLVAKKKQSYERSMKRILAELENLDKGIVYKGISLNELLDANENQENIIKNL